MTIGDIMAKHFDEFKAMVRNPDRTIENGNTSEDVFMSAVLTTLNKYKTADIDEKEGYEYAKKTILMEWLFCPKRKKRDLLLFSDDLPDIPYDDPNMS